MGQREWGYIHDTTSLGEHQLACCLEEMDGWDQSWMGLNLIVIMWWTVRLALVPGKDADTVRLSVCVWTLLSDFSGTPSAFSWVIFAEDVLLTSLLYPPRTPALSVDTGHTGRHLWPPTTQPLIHCLSLSGDLVGQAQKVWCSLLPRCPYTVCLTVLTLDWPTHVLVLIKGEQGQRSLQLADVEGQLKLS